MERSSGTLPQQRSLKCTKPIDLTTAEEGFRALLQLPDEGADHVGEGDRGFRQARAFVHQLGAEDAFEGAHMPSLAAADVLGDGGSAIKNSCCRHRGKTGPWGWCTNSSSGISRGPSLPMAATVEFDVPKSTPQQNVVVNSRPWPAAFILDHAGIGDNLGP